MNEEIEGVDEDIVDDAEDTEIEDVDTTDPDDADTDVLDEDEEKADEGEADFDPDDLEYDENGDIIIPEDKESKEIEKEDTSPKADEIDTPPAAEEKKEDERDARIAELLAKLEELESQSKDTLKKLGIDKDDILEGLADLAAEASDTTTEEYLAKRREEAEKEKQRKSAELAQFEAVAAADLAILKENFPETKAYGHIKDMPSEVLKKFADYRNKGIPAKEAYAAANVDGIRAGVATSARKQAQSDAKAHLQSSVPKGSRDSGVRMTRSTLVEWRGIFPGMTDKEIISLYKKTASKD